MARRAKSLDDTWLNSSFTSICALSWRGPVILARRTSSPAWTIVSFTASSCSELMPPPFILAPSVLSVVPASSIGPSRRAVFPSRLMTRPAVSATVPPMTVPFPLNVRFLQEGWKIPCFRSRRYRPAPARDAQWNRGAYLAQAVSDCGGCHTPRNALGGEKLRDAYSGTVVDNWIAPPFTEANPSPNHVAETSKTPS